MRYLSILLGLLAMLAPPALEASLSDYAFSYGTGSLMEPSNTTALWSGSPGTYYYGYVSSFSIPFDFMFDGVSYRNVSVSTSGVIGLGTTDVTSSTWNYLPGERMPIIAPLWDEHRVSGTRGGVISPQVTYGIIGDEPNRILVITYDEIELMAWYWWGARDFNYGTWQARLYEGSAKIEFYYDDLTLCDSWGNCVYASSSIGIANEYGEYMSVTPYGNWADLQRYWSNDWIDLNYNSIDDGTLYTFQPCTINPVVNTSVGGSTEETLLGQAEVQNWDTQYFQPLTIRNDTRGCGNSRYYQMWIDGPQASEYEVLAPEGWLEYGSEVLPTIRFTPTALGIREATLHIIDNNFFTRSYRLAAISIPRIAWVPDLSEGGTPGMVNGDTLLHGILVPRPEYRDFTPFTLSNINGNPEAPAAEITIEIDSLGEPSVQFELLTPTSLSLLAGESHTPVIRFRTFGVGYQEARITVIADGERRSFLLRPISAAPAIRLTDGNGALIDAGNPLFQWTENCAGDQANTTAVTVENTGTMPLIVSSISFWLTDTTDQQGTPLFPLVRDERGRTMISADYAFSDIPGVAPISANSVVTTPFTIQPGESRRIYATFVPQMPGKRYARAFFRTNAQNVYGTDTTAGATPGSVMGLMTADLVGRGIGATLAADPSGLDLETVAFSPVRVGEWAEMSFTLSNSGICDLRILRDQLRVFSGDVREFTLMSVLPNTPVDANRNYVLAPGAVDSIVVRFMPSRAGTRMATMKIQTNDSLKILPGISERGAYYLDLTGRGRAGLDGRDLVLSPTLVGSYSDGIAQFENTLTGVIDVASVEFLGDESAEFVENPSRPWSPRPIRVAPGDRLLLSVRMLPVGVPGWRRTEMIVITTTGDTARLSISGEAGTQEVVVGPDRLFDNVIIGVGESARRTATITNNGTMPLRLTSVVITGPDAANYRLGAMPRMDLVGGATEHVEITFSPTAQGQSSAQLDVTFAGVTRTVLLGGTGQSVRGGEVDPSTGTIGENGTPQLTFESLSGINEVTAGSRALSISPNPARDEVTLGYILTQAGQVSIDLFDAAGAHVGSVPSEQIAAGARATQLDVSSLAAGTYRIRLVAGPSTWLGVFTIVR